MQYSAECVDRIGHIDHDAERAVAVSRVIFYLELADSFSNDARAFESASEYDSHGFDRSGNSSRRDQRHELCVKAFQALAQNFFRNKRPADERPSWFNLATEPAVLEKLLWFFRLDDNDHIPNLGRRVGWPNMTFHQATEEFLQTLCRLAWQKLWWSGDRPTASQLAVLEAARPQLVERLYGADRLDLLFEGSEPVNDEPSLAKLEELAFRPLHFPDGFGFVHRAPQSLREAAHAGSSAARALLVLRPIQEQSKYLAELAAARKLAQQAEAHALDVERQAPA